MRALEHEGGSIHLGSIILQLKYLTFESAINHEKIRDCSTFCLCNSKSINNLSLILSYIITIISGFKSNFSLIFFGITNGIFLWIGLHIFAKSDNSYFNLPFNNKEKKPAIEQVGNVILEDIDLRNSLKQILENSLNLTQSTQNIFEQNHEQLEIVNQAADNSKEINEVVFKASEFTDYANQEAQNATKVSADAGDAVNKMVETMREIEKNSEQTSLKISILAEKSKQIGEIISFPFLCSPSMGELLWVKVPSIPCVVGNA